MSNPMFSWPPAYYVWGELSSKLKKAFVKLLSVSTVYDEYHALKS